MNTIRITKATASAVHRGPDGSMKLPEGTVLAVGEGYGQVDASSAARWIRGGFAEEFTGEPGTRVSNEDAGRSAGELAAEITRLQALHQAAVTRGGYPGTRITRAGAPGEGATGSLSASLQPDDAHGSPVGVPTDRPIGDAPYRDPHAPHPLARYDLTDKQRAALERAGFARPDHVERASDEELLEVEGIGESALKKLRG